MASRTAEVMNRSGTNQSGVIIKKENARSNGLGPHEACFDFRFPDNVGGLQALNAHLSFQGSAFLSDPRNFIARAAVLALHPYGLPNGLDSRWRYQTRPGCGNLIGTAILRFNAGDVRKYFHRHGNMQPLLTAFFRSV